MKKLLSILCAVVMLLSVAACTAPHGGGSDVPSNTSSEETSTERKWAWSNDGEETEEMAAFREKMESIMNAEDIAEVFAVRGQGSALREYTLKDRESIAAVQEWLEKISPSITEDPGECDGGGFIVLSIKQSEDEEVLIHILDHGASGRFISDGFTYCLIENWDEINQELIDILNANKN